MAYGNKNKKNAREILDAQLKDDAVKGAYVFYGEEEYLKMTYVERVAQNRLGKGYDGFSCTTLNGETYTYEALAESVENVSFIAENKVVLVRDLSIEQIRNDSALLKELFQYADDSVTVIFIFNADFLASKDFETNRKRTDAIKSMSSFATVLEFTKMNAGELSKWACKLAFKAGTSMAESVALYLCQRCGFDMGKIKNEVLKLAIYKPNGQIERADIDTVTPASVEESVFALSNSIMACAPKKVLSTIDAYRQNKESPRLILANLTAAFYEMCGARAAVASGVTDVNVLIDELGLSKNKSYFIGEYMRKCKDMPPSFFVKFFDMAKGCDKAFKEGEGESWERIEMLCLEAVALLQAEKNKFVRW